MRNQQIARMAKDKGFGAVVANGSTFIFLKNRNAMVSEVAFELDLPQELFQQQNTGVIITGTDS